MRKKSHILLARYLADQMQTTASLQSHRKAFCLGSILPDIKPSFITRRHEFYGTFEDVKNRMKELADIRPDESNQRVYWRRFGEVIHYMADYFTFPHNKTYTGSFSQHNHYEKVLKNRLKECIQQGEAYAYLEPAIRFADFSTLIDYIEATHEKYLNKLRSVEEDIRSHILLARYLADQMQTTASLQSHRKAFCLGSILPDIKPSFITRRHEFYGTFEDVKNRMKELADIRPDESNQRVYWRRFGEVIHYMADYFTFPHNKTYTGSFSQHNHYEKVLKNRLKECIQQGEAYAYLEPAIRFADFSTLIDYIEATHEKYLNKLRSVEEDIRFILNMCFQVVQGLIQICIGNKNFAGAIQAA